MKTANIRLAMGLLALPAILLQKSFIGIILQALYVIVLAVSHGRRFRILPNLILLFSVSSAHLLQPHGLQLFSIGNFAITAGALVLGARKAFTLIALLYLSHYMVTARPNFPGKLGKLISLQFYYFERITTIWRTITPKRPFIKAIDNMLLQLSVGGKEPFSTQVKEKASVTSSARNIGKNTLHLIILWTLFVLGNLAIFPVI